MLEDLKGLFCKKKVCKRCGAQEGVKKVYVSNFSGHGHFENLCISCATLEKAKKY